RFMLKDDADDLNADADDWPAKFATRLDGPDWTNSYLFVLLAYNAIEGMTELGAAPEPPGRAHSQLACDPKNGKIVLFGGNGLDRCYGDTWVYDCKTRKWEQRFPKESPSPRAGHALVYLPKSGRIALAGGYTID